MLGSASRVLGRIHVARGFYYLAGSLADLVLASMRRFFSLPVPSIPRPSLVHGLGARIRL